MKGSPVGHELVGEHVAKVRNGIILLILHPCLEHVFGSPEIATCA